MSWIVAALACSACADRVTGTGATTDAPATSDAQTAGDSDATSAGPATSSSSGATVTTTADATDPVTTQTDATTDPTSDATTDDAPVCGDALVEAPERCDDGNTVEHDGCDATCSSDAGAALWLDLYEGAEGAAVDANALTRSLTGDIIAAGYELSPIEQVDTMPYTGWLRAYSPDGALLWSTIPDLSPYSDQLYAVKTAPDGDLVTAGVAHDSTCTDGCYYGLVSRFSPDGALLWSTLGPIDGYMHDVAIGEDGSVYAVGDDWNDWVPPRMQLMRLTGDGALLWTMTIVPSGAPTHGRLNAAETRGDGALIVAGALQRYQPDEDLDTDGWLAALTPEGAITWERRLDGGQQGHDVINGLALAPGGDIVLTGYAGVDVEQVIDDDDMPALEQRDALWLVRATADGEPLWSTTLTTLPSSSGQRVALHPEHIVVAGSSATDEESQHQLVYASFSHDGALAWWSATDHALASTRAVLVVDDGAPGGAVYLAGASPDSWVGRFASAP